MKRIPQDIIDFLRQQGFVVISSLDEAGFPHSSCKAIVKIDEAGKILLMDVYHGKTCQNIERSQQVSISAVDEHNFMGYCLKGKARVMPDNNMTQEIIKKWEDNITSRIAKRLLRNLTRESTQGHHPEASLPFPKHLIEIQVEEIVDLAPAQLRREK